MLESTTDIITNHRIQQPRSVATLLVGTGSCHELPLLIHSDPNPVPNYNRYDK